MSRQMANGCCLTSPPPARLAAIVVSLTPRLPLFAIAPPVAAEFPAKVVRLRPAVPLFRRPPPAPAATLPENVEPDTWRMPSFITPPPPVVAAVVCVEVFAETVQSVSVRLPEAVL